MVFDVIVCSTRKILCNFCPFITIFSMGSNYNLIFLWSPFPSFDFWVQMVMPSFSALFSYSSWQITRDDAPIFRSILFDELNHLLIFFFRPRSFYKVRIQNLLPSMKTLHIRSVSEIRCNLLPILCLMLTFLHRIFQRVESAYHPCIRNTYFFFGPVLLFLWF